MKAALRAYILQRPVAAFKTLVMPLRPEDVRVDVAGQRVVVWRSFMEDAAIKTAEQTEARSQEHPVIATIRNDGQHNSQPTSSSGQPCGSLNTQDYGRPSFPQTPTPARAGHDR